MGNRRVQIGQMEEQLKEWGTKLETLPATTAADKETTDESRVASDLRAMHVLAQASLSDLKAARRDRWHTFKAGVDGAYKNLDAAFKKLMG